MFERDKDDLRSLGITIELGTFDPLFEDEAGYRIKPENYALQLEDLDTTDLTLLSQASKLWREAALGSAAQTGLRKLKALGIDSDFDVVVDLSPQLHATPEQLPDLIEAITERHRIGFEYLDEDFKANLRNIEPYRLSNSRGYWYLIGYDLDRNALRTFRLDRIASSISLKGNSSSFEIDQLQLDELESTYLDSTQNAIIAIRKGTSQNLRNAGAITEFDDEWDSVDIQYQSEDAILQEVFWHGENAFVLSPQSLRTAAIERLEKALAEHG
jgi:proteasome accessory factor B